MPMISGSIYLFGELLSFALPVSLVITFWSFFYRLSKRADNHDAPVPAAVAATPAAASPVTMTEAPAEPSRPADL